MEAFPTQSDHIASILQRCILRPQREGIFAESATLILLSDLLVVKEVQTWTYIFNKCLFMGL